MRPRAGPFRGHSAARVRGDSGLSLRPGAGSVVTGFASAGCVVRGRFLGLRQLRVGFPWTAEADISSLHCF